MRRLPKAVTALIAACALLPAGAAASGQAVINDCVAHSGTLTKVYKASDYAWALAHLPADVLQYTDCSDTIAAAARAARISRAKPGAPTAPGGGSSSWGTATGIPGVPPGTDPLATIKPAEQAGIAKKIARGASEPVLVGGRPLVPEAATGTLLSRISRLPDPVLALTIALALLAALAVATAAHHAYRNVRQRRATD